jgi:hypothetical protein
MTMEKKSAIAAGVMLALIHLSAVHAATIPVQRIVFPPGGDSATRNGMLRNGGMNRYVLAAQADQTLNANVTSPENTVILVIFGKDGTVLLTDHVDQSSYSGTLPSTQDYYIDVRATDGTSASYTLSVTIPPGPPDPPQPTEQMIFFAPGTDSATVSGTLTPQSSAAYGLQANVGQRMIVNVTTGSGQQSSVVTGGPPPQAVLSVYGADGTVLLSSMPGATSFSGTLPSTQVWYLKVSSVSEATVKYQMSVTIEPLVY